MVWFGLEAEDYDRKFSDKDLLNKMKPHFLKYKKYLIIVIFFMTLSSLVNGMIPWLTAKILNINYLSENLSKFIVLIVLLFMIYFSGWIFYWFRQIYSSKIIGNLVLDLEKEANNAALNQDLSFFDKFSTGKITSRINSDTKNFGEMAELFMDSASSLIIVFFIFIPMFVINQFLSIVLLITVPVIFIIALSFRKSARKKTLIGQRSNALVNSYIQETMTGIQIAKTFRQEEKIYHQFDKINKQAFKINFQRALLLNILFPLLFIVQGITLAVIVYYGGDLLLSNNLSAGDIFLFIQSLWALFFPLFSIAAFWPQFQSGLAAAERIFSLIEAPHSVIQNNNEKMNIEEGIIQIKNLIFSYLVDSSDRPINVYDNFSLKIRSGESIAIVGHTGAGKSTLAKIIGRFYEYQSGEITIDGNDIRDLDLKYFRKQIGFIPQTPYIWADTLKNNIRYGKLDASDDEISIAVERSGGWDWIEDLPDGIETNVNEKGKLLSMGQRQLVALARVLLKDPKILILDEATASIDPFTETLIQEAIENTMKDRTTIVIAHRLWTVRNVDRIIVLDHGKIIEEGSHNHLMKKGGYYADLYNTYFRHQSYDYIEKSVNN